MKKVLLLLAEGFEIYEASAFIDVIGWNLVDGDGTTRLFTAAATREVKSTFGQKLIADYTFDEINVTLFDALAIPGGFEEYGFYPSAYSQSFQDIIRQFAQKDKLIASICTGAFPIAKTGLLQGKRGTTYNKNPKRHEALAALGVLVAQEPIVMEGNIITSWNPSTAMEVAFKLLEHLTSAEQADKIRILMGFEGQARGQKL